MSYHIYQTQGFIIGSKDIGEADRFLEIFTKDFGFLRATARGVREWKSKLRYSLGRYTLAELYLVRGKSGWRVTNATSGQNIFEDLRGEQKKFLMVARIFSLLRRLLQGEEKNEGLFVVLEKGVVFLKSISEQDLYRVEPIFVLRILDCLGYVAKAVETRALLQSADWNEEILESTKEVLPMIVGSINQSLRESQL